MDPNGSQKFPVYSHFTKVNIVRTKVLTQVVLITVLGLVADSTLNKAFAQSQTALESAVSDIESNASSVDSEISQILGTEEVISTEQGLDNTVYSSANLLEPVSGIDVAQRPIDLDVFCANYPYNSRCENYAPDAPAESESNTSSDSSGSSAQSAWALGTDFSSLGFGATVTRRINPRLNVRGAINGFSFGTDVEDTDVNYEVDLKLFNISTVVDYHPVKNLGFRISTGLIFNDNKLEGSGKPSGAVGSQTFEFNDTTYTLDDVGSVDAEVNFGSSVAPYLGIGWGNAVKPGQRWGFSANVGVMFPGSPDVDISPNTTLTGAELTALEDDIAAEEKALEDDLDFLTVYPVVSVGVTYHF